MTHSADHSEQTDSQHASPTAPETAALQADTPALPTGLTVGTIPGGRGNAPVQRAAILQMQQQSGNRATRQAVQRAVMIQRTKWKKTDVDDFVRRNPPRRRETVDDYMARIQEESLITAKDYTDNSAAIRSAANGILNPTTEEVTDEPAPTMRVQLQKGRSTPFSQAITGNRTTGVTYNELNAALQALLTAHGDMAGIGEAVADQRNYWRGFRGGGSRGANSNRSVYFYPKPGEKWRVDVENIRGVNVKQ